MLLELVEIIADHCSKQTIKNVEFVVKFCDKRLRNLLQRYYPHGKLSILELLQTFFLLALLLNFVANDLRICGKCILA